MLSKKRAPRIRFVYCKLGTLNNYFNAQFARITFLNIRKGRFIANLGYKMNRAAYKNLGRVLPIVGNKEGRLYKDNILHES